jgi:hypothetical protein
MSAASEVLPEQPPPWPASGTAVNKPWRHRQFQQSSEFLDRRVRFVTGLELRELRPHRR